MLKKFLFMSIILLTAVSSAARGGPSGPEKNSDPIATSGKRFAFLVGINKYQHPRLSKLSCCENDGSELAQVLQSGGYQVTLLRGQDATKSNIKQRLDALLAAARDDDSILVAFSGHGVQFQKEAYFCPVDARPSSEETESLLSLAELYRDLERSRAGVKVLLVDACRDGAAGLPGVDGDSSSRPPRGVAAFFSCAAGEVAYEDAALKHSIFFHYVLQGLRGRAGNVRGDITFASLVHYVSEEVDRNVPQIVGGGARQSPTMKANLTGASPVLYRSR